MKPCGPGTRCWCQVGGGFACPTGLTQNRQSADDGDKTNSSPGRARRKPLKPLRAGMPGDSGATVVTTLCLLPMHRGCGCIGHPAFPTPSMGREILQGLGRNASRQCEHISGRHRPPPGRANARPMTGSSRRSIISANSTDAASVPSALRAIRNFRSDDPQIYGLSCRLNVASRCYAMQGRATDSRH